MEQMRNFDWAQDKISELTNTGRDERHEAQRVFGAENRAQRRERERQERREAKRKAKA